MLDITQAELAAAVGVSRPYVALIESGDANPSLNVVDRIAATLGIELALTERRPIALNSPRQRDLVHARCSGYVARRLGTLSWIVRREVTVIRGRTRGWIDLLAYDARRRLLLVIEIKTWIDDLGSVERQLDWYLREAPLLVREFGWRPRRTIGVVLALATSEVDAALRRNQDVVEQALPGRASDIRGLLAGEDEVAFARGIALIDPANRRRQWIIPSGLDGRRTPAPYADLREVTTRMSARDDSS
jgi:transcriptional regulator with XRE-family HTH domain